MKLNRATIELIKHFEGLALKPYVCQGNKLTIGFGHVISPSDAIKYRDGISVAEAEMLLYGDLGTARRGVERAVKVSLNPNQFGALVSFAFNLGVGSLNSSTLLRKVNAGKFEEAAAQFPRWVFAGGRKWAGLQRRREAERKLFCT